MTPAQWEEEASFVDRGETRDPLMGLSQREREIMRGLLRMPPQQHKMAQRPMSPKGEAQRHRRERERQPVTDTNSAD
jgi:hypothetical protein